ncbi:MAG: hypothetical protein KAQ63_00385 [Candidatus Moranbacteria bacterium]|nr:hypothetical protein [Candidatus Moranbacteria bacterium]
MRPIKIKSPGDAIALPAIFLWKKYWLSVISGLNWCFLFWGNYGSMKNANIK